ncbi:unnamed protein product [Camellia sinensis]
MLEKVSSGRWQSSQPIHHPTDVEVRHTTIETESRSKGDNFYNKSSYYPVGMVGRVEYHDSIVLRYAEGVGRELATCERARSPMLLETVENNPPSYVDGVQPARNEGKFGGSELESSVPLEQSERPKLYLLPRHKPLESMEPPADHKQGSQNSDHLKNVTESYGNANYTNSVLSQSDSGNRAVECPKLNLKPRSQPFEQFKGNIERERTVNDGYEAISEYALLLDDLKPSFPSLNLLLIIVNAKLWIGHGKSYSGGKHLVLVGLGDDDQCMEDDFAACYTAAVLEYRVVYHDGTDASILDKSMSMSNGHAVAS